MFNIIFSSYIIGLFTISGLTLHYSKKSIQDYNPNVEFDLS